LRARSTSPDSRFARRHPHARSRDLPRDRPREYRGHAPLLRGRPRPLAAARALAVFESSGRGGLDLLVAFPHRGANLRRVAALARAHPRARVSVLVEDEPHLAEVLASGPELGAFIDVN